MIMPEGEQRQLTFIWYTPTPTPQQHATSVPPSQYQLLIQRQAGAVLTAAVTISPVRGMTVTNASAATVKNGVAEWAATLFVSDIQIGVSVSKS